MFLIRIIQCGKDDSEMADLLIVFINDKITRDCV